MDKLLFKNKCTRISLNGDELPGPLVACEADRVGACGQGFLREIERGNISCIDTATIEMGDGKNQNPSNSTDRGLEQEQLHPSLL